MGHLQSGTSICENLFQKYLPHNPLLFFMTL